MKKSFVALISSLKPVIQKRILFILPSLAALASLILVVLVIYPQLRLILTNQKSMDNAQGKLKSLEVKAEELDGLDQADLVKKLNLASEALPPEKDFASTIGALQGLILKSGMSLSSLQFSQGSPDKNQNSFSVKVETQGSKLSLTQLMAFVGRVSPLMKVAGVDITSLRGADLVAASLTIDIYYSPLPKQLGVIDAPLPKLSDEDEKLLVSIARFSASSGESSKVLPSRGKSNPFE